jgi:hypothetical protein
MTLATSGRIGIDSSASADLQSSLENKLMERLDTAGSTLFKLTWKRKSTPLGRRYLERAASAHRTGDSGFTSLPTPSVHNYEQQDQDALNARRQRCKEETGNGNGFGMTLGNTAHLAAVPTPRSNSSTETPEAADIRGARPNKNGDNLDGIVTLAAVPTPNAMEGGQTSRGGKRYDEKLMGGIAKLAACPTPMAGTPAQNGYNEAGNSDYSRKIVELETCATPRSEDSECAGAHRGTADGLHSQANLSAVATPAARDYRSEIATDEFNKRRWNHKRGKALSAQVTLQTVATPNTRYHHGESAASSMRRVESGKQVDLTHEAQLFVPGEALDGSTRKRVDQLPRQAQLADSGQAATGGTVETASTGQLNPDYSRWLQGFPAVWGSCADTGTLSASRPRKRS